MTTELTIGAINPGYGGLPIGVAAALGGAQLAPVARLCASTTRTRSPATSPRGFPRWWTCSPSTGTTPGRCPPGR